MLVFSDVANVWTFLAALALAVPAWIAAVTSLRNRSALRTANGNMVGAQMDALTSDVLELKSAAAQNRAAIIWLTRELTGGDRPLGLDEA